MVNNNLLRTAIAGVSGIAALGFSALSFAGSDFVSAPAPTVAVEEDNSGFYAGIRAGYANTRWSKGFDDVQKSFYNIDDKGFAGGVLLGYAFNKNFSVEAAYTYLPQAKLSLKNVEEMIQKSKVRNQAIDLTAKVSMPIPSIENVGVYAKAGIGVLHTKENSEFVIPGFYSESSKESQRHAGLTFGAGAYWNVNSNVKVDAGWQRWNGTGSNHSSKYIPNMDAVTVGVTYSFGQFDELVNI